MRFIQCAFLFILAMLVVDITASSQLPSLRRGLLPCKTNADCPDAFMCFPDDDDNGGTCRIILP